jgi:RNA polymerase sigma factor (sigma-70 family)
MVRLHSRRLFAIAYAILRDPAEADDAVQEVMFRAWRAWEKTAEHADPGPWLTRICVNWCLSRRASLRIGWGRTATLDATIPAAHAAAEDPQLAAAYARLTRRQRAVVLLHYQLGYSLDECAELMGCRPGTVRSHLGRALATLRAVGGVTRWSPSRDRLQALFVGQCEGMPHEMRPRLRGTRLHRAQPV